MFSYVARFCSFLWLKFHCVCIPHPLYPLSWLHSSPGFPDGSVGKEFDCDAGDRSSIPESGRSAGEGIGCPLQYSWVSLLAQLVESPPVMWETWVQSLGWKDSLEKGKANLKSSILARRVPWAVLSMRSQRAGHN